jgi:hypothetical protein
MEEKSKRGRPRKTEERYDKPFRFNGTEDHLYMKRTLEKELGKNGGEIMRDALEFYFNVKVQR